MNKLKLLFLDLETAPLLAYIWRPNQEFIPYHAMVQDSFLLSWSAKWEDSDVVGMSLTGAEARAQDDERIVLALAKLLRQADIVVAHNATSFDIPMFNSRLLLLGLEPMGRVKTIDTLRLARQNFNLSHNNLDYLASLLGVGAKIETNLQLW